MILRCTGWLLLAALCLSPALADDVLISESEQQPVTQIPFLEGAVTIDGNLNEPQWQQARVISLDYVTRPYNNTKPPVSTQVKLFEDGETLHVAFIAEDPDPEQIRAFFRDRDKVWSDDLVGIKLDTFNNGRLAYQFFINPLGVQADAIQNEMTGNESDSWNAIWESAGVINDNGYVVEVAIPLRIMNFEEGERTKLWGAEFVRFYPRQERLRIANIPWDRNDACTLCQLSDVKGFEQATQGKNLALVPTLVLGKGRSRDPFSSNEWDDIEVVEPGLDVKWGITPEMSLQATLNPDFSQVEADDAQVNINNTFALFFDERRPFFVENADYFSSNQRLVYTRNIGSPDYGLKLTGQKERHTFGVFMADDANTTFIVPGNLGSGIAVLEDESLNGALRYRFDYDNDLSIGSVTTFRQAGDYHNFVNGLDVKYRLTQQDTLRAQYVVSNTQYPENLYTNFCGNDCSEADDLSETAIRTRQTEAFSGTAWRVNYRHEEQDWFFRADRYENDAGFRADLGFETKADYNKTVVGGGYFWWNENSWWNRIRLNGDWDLTHNDNGEVLERELEAYVSIRGMWQSFLELGTVRRERVGLRHDPSTLAVTGNTDRFDEQSVSVYAETRPNPTLFVSTFVRKGDQIDFANNRLGKQLFVESMIDVNLGKHTQLRFTQLYSNLDVASDTLFTARISDLRLTYQLDARQFVRLIGIYNNTHRNQDNYQFDVKPVTRTLGGQLLYSYKLNPLTRFFVGVSSAAVEENPLTGLTTTNKSVFMKFSYAWLY
ncbi:MAG: carbohydrate binding family 9 domain-containing protein [Aestuariibacter sp.]|jgi:hypothetical protein|uniref:carbohydrate binding family 9 domain-containing protein n=1 Tax=Marisediminitalea aggregata TaxID=634436 RepID=UPI0020CBE33B|nr:DUF5916 domain-containing protein [Marisediminitalea aggregata]MCP4524337.1 carbohydrate binding family 9 domain-containing protein [Aestuariibacter sp.]MCP9477554.1 carbohydrate binding family 9 domain-containing protein [Marisediminitalea aggregata]|tara:strand:- start:10141 stop:12465 length:2325 start_codon:yes stop_codon:yes gene_type:complete